MNQSSRKGEVDRKFPVWAIVCFIFNAGKKLSELSSSLILLSRRLPEMRQLIDELAYITKNVVNYCNSHCDVFGLDILN